MNGPSVIFDDKSIKKNIFIEVESHLVLVILMLIK